jgi:hypothetical protein
MGNYDAEHELSQRIVEAEFRARHARRAVIYATGAYKEQEILRAERNEAIASGLRTKCDFPPMTKDRK